VIRSLRGSRAGGVKPVSRTAKPTPSGCAISNAIETRCLNATILNQLGFNHANLMFLHEGRSERSTVVYGHVVKDILT
jgi:hypothetical protein